MAKRDNVSAPPAPTPVPTPTPTPDSVLPVVEGEGTTEVTTPTPDDGTVPVGEGAGNRLPNDVPAPTPDTGVEVQPEIGGEPIKDNVNETTIADDLENSREQAEQDEAMAEEAFATLADVPFDPATNLGDWDGDGKAGGSAPSVDEKEDSEKTNAELGEEVGIAHAGGAYENKLNCQVIKPARDMIKKVVDDKGGKLPNGKTFDDEFWTAYDQAFDREVEQLAADVLDDDERLRRIEKTLGLRSPRQ